MDIHITITPDQIWSWWGVLVFIVAGIVGLAVGSLPDNEKKPTGDYVRMVLWFLDAVWLVGLCLRGLRVF